MTDNSPSWTGLLAAHAPTDPFFIHPMLIVQQGEANMGLHLQSVDLAFPGLQVLHADPPVFTCSNFLPEAVCERMIRNALSGKGFPLGKSATHGSGGTQRSSSSWLIQNSDCSELIECAQSLTGVRKENYEAVQLIRYREGESFENHLDYLPTAASRLSQGNRLATLLVYLNTAKEGTAGGDTCFRDLGLSVAPLIGTGLLFFPTFANGGECDFRTIHSSRPVGEGGIKYVAQIFMREGAFTAAERAALFCM